MPEISTSFKLECPVGKSDELSLVAAQWVGSTPLTADGFSFQDARLSSTEDETVECQTCGHRFPLTEITL